MSEGEWRKGLPYRKIQERLDFSFPVLWKCQQEAVPRRGKQSGVRGPWLKCILQPSMSTSAEGMDFSGSKSIFPSLVRSVTPVPAYIVTRYCICSDVVRSRGFLNDILDHSVPFVHELSAKEQLFFKERLNYLEKKKWWNLHSSKPMRFTKRFYNYIFFSFTKRPFTTTRISFIFHSHLRFSFIITFWCYSV